jgi:hypothetical protein
MPGPLVEGTWDIRAKDVTNKKRWVVLQPKRVEENEKKFSNQKSTHAQPIGSTASAIAV